MELHLTLPRPLHSILNKTLIRVISLPLLSLSLLMSCGQEQAEPAPEPTTSRVSTQTLESLLIAYNYYRPAAAISLNNTVLSAEISAQIAAINVDVGETVAADTILLELNCRDENNRLEQARAQLAADTASAKLSELDYRRAQQLFKKKTLSKQELDRRQSELARNRASVRNGQATLALATGNIAKCTVRAPFAGVITERMANLGQLAAPATALLRLVDTDNLEVSAQLSLSEVNSLQQSKAIHFVQNQQRYPLTLSRVTPAVDNISRTQEVRLSFNEAKPLPGSAGELEWTDALPALPAEFLSQRDGKLGVLYVDKSTVDKSTDDKSAADKNTNASEPRAAFYVIESAQEGQPAPIALESLGPDTAIITAGRFGIAPGDTIDIVDTVNTADTVEQQ